jgi:hypothetical protein
MYSRHSGGFLASSALSRMLLELRLQLPFCLHLLHKKSLDFDAHERLLFCDYWRHRPLEFCSIPFIDYRLSPILACAGSHA